MTAPQPAPQQSNSTLPWILAGAFGVVATLACGIMVISQTRQMNQQPGAGEGPVPIATGLTRGQDPYVQTDTVNPKSQSSGTVYYPIPYAAPPQLKIRSTKREYIVLKQDESSFTWIAKPLVDDFLDDLKADPGRLDELLKLTLDELLMGNRLRANIVYEDFVFEAKGVRGDGGLLRSRPYEQRGEFDAPPGEEGVVFFPTPYDSPPNVEINSPKIVIKDCTEKSFKWKSTDKTFSDKVRWTAKGMRANPKP